MKDHTKVPFDHDTMNFRLALTFATAQILNNGLYLLGIKTLEKI